MHPYTLRRSRRRTISLEITPTGEILVRAPMRMPEAAIRAFVEKHDGWIEKYRPAVLEKAAVMEEIIPQRQAELIARAKEELPRRVAHWAAVMDLSPSGVKITGAAKRFGSCSAKNSLCFSWRLLLYPPEAVDYVVVHELAHIVHKNHQAGFYALVARYLPDYKQREALLRCPPQNTNP